jgi:hypothetical protein
MQKGEKLRESGDHSFAKQFTNLGHLNTVLDITAGIN